MKKALIAVLCVVLVGAGVLILKNKNNNSESGTTTEPITISETEAISVLTTEEETTTTATTTTTTTTTTTSTTASKAKSTSKKQPTSVKTTLSTTKKISKATYINGILIANKTYALPSDYNPGVDPEAQRAVNEMIVAAKEDGIELWVRSGFRSYSYQANLYNNYVKRDGKAKADTYSARPGHSEHQTGLAFDMNSLSTSFAGTPEGKWLAAHCYEYGFIIRYPKGKESITGYQYEPWHVRYLGRDTAEAVYDSGLTLEEYLGINSRYSD